MKKIFSVVLASVIACGAVSAQSLKIVNTFGLGGADLFTFENQKKEDGSYTNEFSNKTRVSDRIQLDASGEKFDGRVRLDLAATQFNGKESTLRLRGYGRFKPINQIQFIAGNDFSTKVAAKAGYLAASDDNPAYGRILQNGFGLASKWTFGEEDNIDFDFGVGLKGSDASFLSKDSLGLDLGFNFGLKELFTLAFTGQNLAGNNLSLAAFAGLSAVENLILNVGYIYNNTDTAFIPKTAKNTVSFTAGYDLQNIGFFLALDVVSAISNEYMAAGESAKYVSDGKDLIPFYSKVRLAYSASESLTFGLEGSLALMLGDSDSMSSEIYPSLSYKLPSSIGELSTGLRMNLDSKGLSQFSIPLNWKVTIAEIKK
ncbi:MAG: hypothetical protein K5829_09985 [Treponema sp.]|nr:hypothetical protein [Treponema sp.]